MDKLDEILAITKVNNIMLQQIIAYINSHGNHTDDFKDFTINVLANLISNK